LPDRCSTTELHFQPCGVTFILLWKASNQKSLYHQTP
jgi:hypothetical protein